MGKLTFEDFKAVQRLFNELFHLQSHWNGPCPISFFTMEGLMKVQPDNSGSGMEPVLNVSTDIFGKYPQDRLVKVFETTFNDLLAVLYIKEEALIRQLAEYGFDAGKPELAKHGQTLKIFHYVDDLTPF